MLKFIKIHWFGLIVSTIFALSIAIIIIVLISPHQNEQNKGFSPCTQQMITDINECNKKNTCVLKSLLKNNLCNIKIIGSGISLWLGGKQETPWDNYLFEEKKPQISPELQDFYKQNPDINQQMIELKKLNKKIGEEL